MTISERSLGTQPTVGGEKTFGANLQTVSESLASEITGLAVKTLQQRRWLGKPPTYLKVGRLVRYRISDLMDYLDSCTVQSKG